MLSGDNSTPKHFMVLIAYFFLSGAALLDTPVSPFPLPENAQQDNAIRGKNEAECYPTKYDVH